MIGFFDSGEGGRCVLDAFRKLCPEEDTVYIADSGHCPYGNKPPAEIVGFAKRIAGDLVARGCEAVVVACNTATAAAIDELRRTWPQVPFVGMEPAIKPAVLSTVTGVVAVLATRGTLNGDLYRKTAARYSGKVRIIECVPDEFVGMVEHGEVTGVSAEKSVRRRLEPLLDAGADRIVLGCTHFPHLKPLMEKVVAGRAEIVDSSEAVARRAKQVLEESRHRRCASRPAEGYTGRLAPSPTGALHLGNVRTFMIAWLRARQAGGKLILRIEDLDHPKHKPGAAAQAVEDLRWLGFDWDEEFVQSGRRNEYAAALAKLRAGGQERVYPCVCSRKDVEAAQSAPHEGEQLRYPGTCRDKFAGWEDAAAAKGAAPCWRFRVPETSVVEFTDGFFGKYRCDVARNFGDFPLARDKDGAGYTLAVTVDDAAMGVTEVVRGADLLAATPQQLLLYRALGLKAPKFFHVPLVVGADGRRLAKRHGDTRIAAFRGEGVAPERVIGFLAGESGIVPQNTSCSLKNLIKCFDPAKMPHEALRLPPDFNLSAVSGCSAALNN